MILLDGKKVAQELYEKLQARVTALKEKNIQPQLALILVGHNPASLSYIKQKRKASEQIGTITNFLHYEDNLVTTESLIATIRQLNDDPKTHGILVQLPLPKHIDATKVIDAVHPSKDVDGFSALNLGTMFLSPHEDILAPCTPKGVMRLLDSYKIDVMGKEVVVVGVSNTVGKPLAVMLTNRRATVTVCHSKTQDLKGHTSKADILIVAVGRAGLVTKDMVKEGAVVVDVGINRTEDGKLVGDVDFTNVSEKASYLTPVPGGCGPMTVACLMENLVQAAVLQNPQLFVS